MSEKISIFITVADKVAGAIGAPTIVCGNGNYQIVFTLDREWETSNAKTARFVFRRDGEVKHIDVAFSGRVVAVPELANIDEVYVGVYAGELYTSTPARVVCKKSIKCGAQKHEAPDPDIYREILQVINNLDTLPTVTSFDAGRALMVNQDGRWAVRLPNFIYDQNSGELLTFFIGTVGEYQAWTGDKDKCIFFPLDLNILDEVEQAFEKFDDRVEAVEKDVGEIQNPRGLYKHQVTVKCYFGFNGVPGGFFSFTISYIDHSATPFTNIFNTRDVEYKGEITAPNGTKFDGRIKRTVFPTNNTSPCFEIEDYSGTYEDDPVYNPWYALEYADDGGDTVRVTDDVLKLA